MAIIYSGEGDQNADWVKRAGEEAHRQDAAIIEDLKQREIKRLRDRAGETTERRPDKGGQA